MHWPRASWMKPAPHLTFGTQRNDPCVFWQSNAWPQLWIPVWHSSISGRRDAGLIPRNADFVPTNFVTFLYRTWICSGTTDLGKAVVQQSYHSRTTDLCSCYCQSVHSQSHSWLLSGNGMSPLCWYTALLPDSCWHPANTRWCLRGWMESLFYCELLQPASALRLPQCARPMKHQRHRFKRPEETYPRRSFHLV